MLKHVDGKGIMNALSKYIHVYIYKLQYFNVLFHLNSLKSDFSSSSDSECELNEDPSNSVIDLTSQVIILFSDTFRIIN